MDVGFETGWITPCLIPGRTDQPPVCLAESGWTGQVRNQGYCDLYHSIPYLEAGAAKTAGGYSRRGRTLQTLSAYYTEKSSRRRVEEIPLPPPVGRSFRLFQPKNRFINRLPAVKTGSMPGHADGISGIRVLWADLTVENAVSHIYFVKFL